MQRHLESDASNTPVTIPESAASALRVYTDHMVGVAAVEEGRSRRDAEQHLGTAKREMVTYLRQHGLQDPNHVADQALNAYKAPLESALGRAA